MGSKVGKRDFFILVGLAHGRTLCRVWEAPPSRSACGAAFRARVEIRMGR